MSPLCPDGHLSTADDWCDTCGLPLTPGPADEGGLADDGALAAPATRSTPPPGTPPPSEPVCPVCAEPRSGSRYCEACAYDFDTGAPLTAPTPQPIRLAPPTPAAPQASTPVEPDAGWVAEVCPDRAFFDRNDDEVEFPDPPTGRRVVLTGERTLIGRRSPRRDIRPQIDLSVAPEDLGVSRAHAFLDHAADGQLTVTDLGSANGTWIGEDRTPIAPGRSLPLADGGHIYVGSFTRITVHRTR